MSLLQTPTTRRFTHALQPIVDVVTRTSFAHEALIRSTNGGGAQTVLSGLTGHRLHAVDRASGLQAIALAARIGMSSCLSINVLPRSVDGEEHAAALALATTTSGFPISKLILEVTEK